MRFFWFVKRRIRLTPRNLLLLSLLVLGVASCTHPPQQARKPDPVYLGPGWPKGHEQFQEADCPVLKVEYPEIEEAEFVDDDELCMTCHETYVKSFAHNVHREQKCEDCHGPASRHLITRGSEPGLVFSFKTLQPAEKAEICLKCHEQDACAPGARWRTSVHAHSNVTCTDCHRGHYDVPPGTPATTLPGQAQNEPPVDQQAATLIRGQSPDSQVDDSEVEDLASLRGYNLGARAPDVCYRCHQETYQLQEIAHPHQIGGPNGFNCTTCHDPHGNLLEYSREELCVKCHDGSTPTAAWHSSTHSLEGVACTDCHNPHPDTHVQQVVDIQHTHVRRPKRLPMAVQDPEVCYKCHADIYGKNAMPSHHPIKEGKMVCGDCHDGHGQYEGNLREATVNQVCYRCHAEVQGPFVYEHPPVTEDCTICHQPHGAVENNLLHQPTTFLCLRCHSGHRTGPRFHDFGLLPDIGTNPELQRAFFSDCTNCHSQIHGSNVPSPRNPHVFVR